MSLELHNGSQANDLQTRMNYAEALAVSNLLPKQYQRQPANVLLAIELGNALGIPPIQAINGIHVVEGKPTASADLIASLVRRAGHKLRIAEQNTPDGPSVTASLIRADDPDFTFSVTWDMGKARAAGLAGKGVWKQYPGQMMRSRAITEVARQGASDALYGVIYTAEELGAETPAAMATSPGKAADQAGVTPPQVQLHASPVEQEPQGLTKEQSGELKQLMEQEQMTAAQMLEFARDVTGRKGIKSAKDLTADEAEIVIAGLRVTATLPQQDDAQIDPDSGEVYDAELIPTTDKDN